MRQLRDIQTIMRDYPLSPDEEDLRRLCVAHLEGLSEARDVTDWIDREDNPYLRELYATETTILIKEYISDGTWGGNVGLYEPIFEELNHIARRAFGQQYGDNLYQAEKIVYTQPQQEAIVQAVPYMQKMKEQMDYMNERLDDMERRLSSAEDKPYWPYYTDKATNEDKRYFEKQLRKFCSSAKRSATKDLKNYLALKVLEGIIIRPTQTNDEWEILRLFGYNKAQKTYYNS